ncbi:MAG: hypothetical protein KDD33_09630 [Bdellovibrionales bacterium]|nr:hypothetical protein [Bdellovibrionales bacterium]
MYKVNLESLSINEKEVSAYVQQQMMDLAPHVDPSKPIEVNLIETDRGFEVELTANHLEGFVQTVGADKNLFTAIRNAKEGLLQYFVELEDELEPHKREQVLSHYNRHGNIYLH